MSNIKSYFGRGLKFNGTDQKVELKPLKFSGQKATFLMTYVASCTANAYLLLSSYNPIIWETTTLLRVYIDGVNHDVYRLTAGEYIELAVIIDSGTLTVIVNGNEEYRAPCGTIRENPTSYRLAENLNFSSIMQGVIVADEVYTPERVAAYFKDPEHFLYREDSILKSDVLPQNAIDKVVSFIPMCDTDKYVRDLVHYSETPIAARMRTSVTDTDEVSTFTKIDDNTFDLAVTTVGTSKARPYLVRELNYNPNFSSKRYKVSFDVKVHSGEPILYQIYNGVYNSTHLPLEDGEHYDIILDLAPDDSYKYFVLYFDGTKLFDISVSNYIITEVTGLHSIDNFTNSCRDNAIEFPHGLQTSKWNRNALGVPNGLSKDLECDGVGYLDTSILPIQNSQFSLEVILSRGNDNGYFGVGFGFDTLRIIVINKYVLYIQVNQTNGGTFVKSFSGNYVLGTLVWDNGTMYAYANGDILGSHSDLTLNNQTIIIGHTNTHIGSGTIRQFKYHEKAMLPEEVKYRYDQAVKAGLLN